MTLVGILANLNGCRDLINKFVFLLKDEVWKIIVSASAPEGLFPYGDLNHLHVAQTSHQRGKSSNNCLVNMKRNLWL
jgi:hypothetical protein